jgi:sugar/nucleoside kinase (ribokinase family)
MADVKNTFIHKTAVAAGMMCLDIYPRLAHLPAGEFFRLFQPGRLVEAEGIVFATGGSVSNTGQALQRLGVPTRLMSKLGADAFGQIVQKLLAGNDPALLEGVTVDAGVETAYTLIFSAPGCDRAFLYSPGAMNTFTEDDIDYTQIMTTDLFHFGYPTIMPRLVEHNGDRLTAIFQRAKECGATTSLDVTFPDPSSPNGRADWHAILAAVLPFVDILQPNLEETLFLLRGENRPGIEPTPALLDDLSSELIHLGAAMVLLKLGEGGLYLRAAGQERVADMGRAAPASPKLGEGGLYLRAAGQERVADMGRAAPANPADWAKKTLHQPCFEVQVAGTTGAGDAATAGFLSGLLRGLGPQEALTAGAAAGACCVEKPDTLSGLMDWDAMMARVKKGWQTR